MCIDSYADISIHTPTRGTTAGTGTATNLAEFQSTFPREERPYYTIVRIQVLQFQSTLPREERPFPTDFVTAFMPYFNPRSHERSDEAVGMLRDKDTLFQSTLPREERHNRRKFNSDSCHFNPRSHERSDSVWNSALYYIQKFQSTLPREERQVPTYIMTTMTMAFQSTLPREERLCRSNL